MAVVALFLGVGLLLAGTVNAWWPRGGMSYGNANEDQLGSFQKETLSLRDELMAKRFELQNEYNKPTYDSKRIATLRKEIVDLETKTQEVADKYGIPTWGVTGGMMRHGIMGRGMIGPMGSMCQMGW
ncbi:MAG: hypothetical protein HY787_11400 [Deltaproteobacteria bacterium]|nr:hypothetical protein [Deltaproteobacteria bacterium]